MKALGALLVVLLIWGAGLFAFADRVERATPPADPGQADGIVVLTGASDERIYAALRLLSEGRGDRLLVSGVNRQVRRQELRDLTPGSNALFDCCVDLGFEAETTVGNAQEIAGWARAKGYERLIVVTSDYHMPRALLEIRGSMRDAELTPYAVPTPSLEADRWRTSQSGVRRMALEYSKYLVVLIREGVLRLFGDARDDPPEEPVEGAASEAATAGA